MIKVTLATKGILAYPGSQEALPSNDGTRGRKEERGRKKANLTPFLSHVVRVFSVNSFARLSYA